MRERKYMSEEITVRVKCTIEPELRQVLIPALTRSKWSEVSEYIKEFFIKKGMYDPEIELDFGNLDDIIPGHSVSIGADDGMVSIYDGSHMFDWRGCDLPGQEYETQYDEVSGKWIFAATIDAYATWVFRRLISVITSDIEEYTEFDAREYQTNMKLPPEYQSNEENIDLSFYCKINGGIFKNPGFDFIPGTQKLDYDSPRTRVRIRQFGFKSFSYYSSKVCSVEDMKKEAQPYLDKYAETDKDIMEIANKRLEERKFSSASHRISVIRWLQKLNFSEEEISQYADYGTILSEELYNFLLDFMIVQDKRKRFFELFDTEEVYQDLLLKQKNSNGTYKDSRLEYWKSDQEEIDEIIQKNPDFYQQQTYYKNNPKQFILDNPKFLGHIQEPCDFD